jgi:hypothetical protein
LKELRTYSRRTSKIKEGGLEGEAGGKEQEEGERQKRETVKVKGRSEIKVPRETTQKTRKIQQKANVERWGYEADR